MTKQPALETSDFERICKPKEGARFLAEMSAVVPWSVPRALTEPIIAARSSSTHAHDKRDPEMQQTENGWQWRFGMKVHVGSDARGNVIHSVVTSTANRSRCKAPEVRDFTCRQCDWKHLTDAAIKAENRNGAGIGTRAEHSIGVATRAFGFTKVRYRGRPKNSNRVRIAATAASIYLIRCKLLGAVRLH